MDPEAAQPAEPGADSDDPKHWPSFASRDRAANTPRQWPGVVRRGRGAGKPKRRRKPRKKTDTKPRKKTDAKPGKKPFMKQSAFVLLFRGDEVYAVRNRAGELGAPGGKRELADRSIWNTARREFREEAGVPMPGGLFAHFQWGTTTHTIRVYYKRLGHGVSMGLPVGATADPDGEEVETLWVPWRGDARAAFRPHIAGALQIYEALPAGT